MTAANLAVWLTASLITTDLFVSSSRRQGAAAEWWPTFKGVFKSWLPMILVTWVVFRLAGHLCRTRASLRTHVLSQIALFVAIRVVFAVVFAWPITDLSAWLGTFVARLRTPFMWTDALVHMTVVAVAYGSIFYRDFQTSARRAADLRARLASAELAALRARLDPHFLYNSLNTVAALVRTDDRPRALEAIARLSELMRAILATHDQTWVPLAREFDIASAYLALQHLRFGHRLEIDLDIDDRCRHAQVPDMLLLPLVENAIRHGTVVGTPQRVALEAQLDGDTVVVGLENRQACAPGSRKGFGIGLETTRARLARLFGPAAVLHLETDADPDGHDVIHTRLTFPFREPLAATTAKTTPAYPPDAQPAHARGTRHDTESRSDA